MVFSFLLPLHAVEVVALPFEANIFPLNSFFSHFNTQH